MSEWKRTYEQYWLGRQSEAEGRTDCTSCPNEIFESVALVLTEGERLLDVGCGNGTVAELARSRFKLVCGCDLAEQALCEASRRGMRSVCADFNAGALPYKNESFDCVTCLEVIEHVLNPLDLLREICRILIPHGQLVLTTPNIRYFRNLTQLIFKGTFPHTTTDTFVWGGGHLHYFTRKDITYLLKEAGFKQVQFLVNMEQFKRSWKRHVIVKIMGRQQFGEWVCGGITVSAVKE